MGELQAVSEISPTVVYSMVSLFQLGGIGSLIELVLRTFNDDDDDDFQGGKGVKMHNLFMHHQEPNGFFSPLLEVR